MACISVLTIADKNIYILWENRRVWIFTPKNLFPCQSPAGEEQIRSTFLTICVRSWSCYFLHHHKIVSFPRDIRRLDRTGSESNGASHLHKHRGDEQQQHQVPASQRINILGKDKWLSTDVPAWAVWVAWAVWAALKLTGKTRYRRAQVRQGVKLLTSDVEHIQITDIRHTLTHVHIV